MHDYQKNNYAAWCVAIAGELGLEARDDFWSVGVEEAVIDMPKFTGYVNGFMGKISKMLGDLSLIPVPFIRSDLDNATIRVMRTSRAALERYTVVTPEYLKGDMIGYLHTLTDVLTALMTIDKQLLIPIEIWCDKMLSSKAYVDQPWLSLPAPTNNVEVHQEVLKAYFNNSVGKGMDNKPFSDVYTNVSEFKDCSAVLDVLNKMALKALDGKLNRRAKNISDAIGRIGKSDRLREAMSRLPESKISTIATLTVECAKQMEMLAIVLYQIRIAGTAFNETVNKINKQL